MRTKISIIFFLFSFTTIFSQSSLNITLNADYISAERMLNFFETKSGNMLELTSLKGNRIAYSTAQMIENKFSNEYLFSTHLRSFQSGIFIDEDIFQLQSSAENLNDIKLLLNFMQKSNFTKKIVATIEQLFPKNSKLNIDIPIYVVAFGSEKVDAFVRIVKWKNNFPIFSNDGEFTIVVNLSSAIEFGRNTEERALNLFSTIAHEVFHAGFGNYQKNSKTWKNFYSKYHSPIFTLLELTMNEGIAYNFSLEQKFGNYNFENWYDKISSSFEKYNLITTQLIAGNITSNEVFEKIKDANTSGFWENYGSVVGFVIAKSIDKNLGREKLIETIEKGAFDFFQKYFECCEMDKNLPKLNKEILKIISKKN